MKYFLYSKALNPNIQEYITKTKRIHTEIYPSITYIAVCKNKSRIQYNLAEFADKYLDGGSGSLRWIMQGSKGKQQLFKEYISKNEERRGDNNFGIISKDGTLFEPLEFIDYVIQFNKEHYDNRPV